MKSRLIPFLTSLSLCLAATSAAAEGFMFWPADKAPHGRPGERPSLDDVVSGVRRHNPGRVLSAETVDRDGRPVHRIKIIDDAGKVRRFRFDGDTGRPLPRPNLRQSQPRPGQGLPPRDGPGRLPPGNRHPAGDHPLPGKLPPPGNLPPGVRGGR